MAAAGLPLVASRLDGLQEAVLDRVTGLLFEPGNARQLADCLAHLLDQPELAAEYGRRARKRCEEELNREVQGARLATAYRKWLNRAR
jgi:glycosyltransferase involved in cell wall biosynthesis